MLELRRGRLGVPEGRAQELTICGKGLLADTSGAVYWPAESALIIADLLYPSIGAAAAGRRDVRRTLTQVAEVIDRYDPDRVLALGGVALAPGETLARADFEMLKVVHEDRQWFWIGETCAPDVAAPFGAEVREELVLSGLTLRHRPNPARITHEIAGALQPAARIAAYGYDLRRPCFISNGLRLILPAFGTLSGGTNVAGDGFHDLMGAERLFVWTLGLEALTPVAPRLLSDD